jgi:acyl-CoA synthetase (AMP-forming)/AMP-acid ligase II
VSTAQPRSQLISDIIGRLVEDGQGDRPAIHFNDESWSFDQLSRRAASICALSRSATSSDQSVAVLGANHPDWVAAYYGVAASGRVLCFLNHRLSPLEILEQMKRAHVGLLITSAQEAQRVSPFLTALEQPVRVVMFDAPLPAGEPGDATDDRRSPDDPAWLIFTSGTTGKPKGVLLSHRNHFAALRSAGEARFVSEHDVFLYPFPLCHVAGYNVPRLHQFGRPVVLMDRFEPASFVESVERHQVSSATVAATMLASLLQHLESAPDDVARLAPLTTLSYGAAPMPAVLLMRAHELLGLEFSQGFGMTELAGNALFLDAADHERGFSEDPSLLRAAGRPGPGVEVKIIDEAGGVAPIGAPGEIAIRGEQVMLGYLDDLVGTERAMADGWLRTGDVGVERNDGIVAVVDRIKDVIVTGGENVASLEVENAIREACHEVRDVAVVGVPDPRWGENVCACVVLNPSSSLGLDQIADRLAESLAGFKIPRHLVIVDALPQTHSGKADKKALRSALSAHPDLLGARRGS